MNGYSQVEYPRFNLVKIDDDEYKIEVALAGWNKKDIEVVHSKLTLTSLFLYLYSRS